MTRKQKKILYRIIIAAVIFVILQLVPFSKWIRLAVYVADYLIIGYDILRKALTGIINGRIFDENFLMALASVGAMVLAIYEGTNEPREAVAVMLFYQVGELFQSIAIGKSRKNIAKLMDIRPDYANVEKDGEIIKVDPEEVEPGTEIVVNPGEKIPIDGNVIDGNSSVNTAALTGESLPKDVCAGDDVISGSINLTGVLRIKTTKPFGESTVSKILELTENASSRKARSEEFISKFARIYTPVVCISAAALAVFPPLVGIIFMDMSPMWAKWIYRALTFLVISCPCALVISIPLSFFGGIGGAGSRGILIKGSNYMETLSKVKTIAFDKTGTLTCGRFEVVNVNAVNGFDDKTLIAYAAFAECSSSHPISQSIRNTYGKTISLDMVSDIKEIAGSGVTALIKDLGGEKNLLDSAKRSPEPLYDTSENGLNGQVHYIAVGNIKLMESLGLSCSTVSKGTTMVHVAIDGEYAGFIEVSDVIKDGSKEALDNLKKAGAERIIMLTGDSGEAAQNIAEKLGIREVYSELLPEDKVKQIEMLLSESIGNKKVAFVGDGINDAPVIMRSDIGIAMGALGSDAAIEAADVVIMDDDPRKISEAIGISKKCLRIVYENIVFAIAVKLMCLILGAFGIANMWLAIFADVGVMVLAVLNAIRMLGVKK